VTHDGFPHVLRSGEYSFVAESHDGIAQRFEEPRAFNVSGELLLVVFAIEFDDEPVSAADEIDDVRADWILASEVVAPEAVRSEVLPQTALSER